MLPIRAVLMDPATRQLIESLHRAPYRCVLSATGGGTRAAALLLNVPGGSRTVLEVVVPYHEQALSEYLGRPPESFCSAETGRAMAERAYQKARWLAPGETVAGLGCTASLATDRPKKGDHRFHLAVRTAGSLTTWSLTLSKGARDREGEEAVLDAVLLNALAEAFGIVERLDVPLLPGERVERDPSLLSDPLARFLRGEVPAVCVESDGRFRAGGPGWALVVPGSFNPVHAGHWGLAAAAARLTGREAAFELSAINVDKPPLPAEEVRRRIDQFAWRAPIWLTRAPTFVEKAALFPGAVFAVGADTAARIIDPRYYQGSAEQTAAALERIRALGCRFLVAGRVDAAGSLVRLAHLKVPPAFADLFAEVPEAEFCHPASSTELRRLECGQAG